MSWDRQGTSKDVTCIHHSLISADNTLLDLHYCSHHNQPNLTIDNDNDDNNNNNNN